MRQSFALEFCDQKLSLEQRGEIWESGSIVGGNNSDGGGKGEGSPHIAFHNNAISLYIRCSTVLHAEKPPIRDNLFCCNQNIVSAYF